MSSAKVLLYHVPIDNGEPPPHVVYGRLMESVSSRFDVEMTSRWPAEGVPAEAGVFCLMAEHAFTDWEALSRQLTSDRIGALVSWVNRGGRLLILAAPPTEKAGINNLLSRFAIMMGPVRIGGKTWRLPENAPVVSGLVWQTRALGTLDVAESAETPAPMLVMNDRSIPPAQPPERDYAGALMVLATAEKGKVAVVSGEHWASDKALASLETQDNLKILTRLLTWLAEES